MTDSPIPFVSLAHTNEQVRAALDTVWDTVTSESSFILGKHVETFEQSWADYCGTSEAIGVGSGTEAIELILRGLDIGAGSEVIVPASTFIATAAAVVAAGATPVFTDVDPETLLMRADHVRAALTPRTAAVIVVHLYGNIGDISSILDVAAAAGIAVVEDAAQAHGARSGDAKAGSLGHAAAFSHYPTKNLGAFGDAGSITTSNAALGRRVRQLRNHGRSTQSDAGYELVGRTGRLDGLQAAILSTKLPHLDQLNAERREIVRWYDELLPPTTRYRTSLDEAAPHLCVTTWTDRDAVRAALAEAGIGSAIHYPDPVPRTVAFGGQRGFPVAEAASDSMVSLPLWPGMTRRHVEVVTGVLRSCA